MNQWETGMRRLAETLGLAWALGLVLFTSLCFALYCCGVREDMTVPLALMPTLGAIVVGTRLLSARRRADDGLGEPRYTSARPASDWGAAASQRSQTVRHLPIAMCGALIVVAAVVGHAAWLALRAPLSAFDAWSIWAFKARMFVLGGPRPSYFHALTTLHTHPDYPLNLPLAEAALFHLPGALGLSLAALLGPACLAALVLLFFAGLTRLHGSAVAAAATVALALVPALSIQSAGGDADVPLALYLGGAALYLLLWWRFRAVTDAVLMALLAGGAIWTKKEGLAVAALLLAAFALGELLRAGDAWRARAWNALRIVLCAVALPLPWLLFTRLAHPLGRDFLPLTAQVFATHADRLPHIVVWFSLQMLYIANWSLLWIVLASVVLLANRRLSGSGRAMLALLIGQLSIYALAFVFSDWQPYTDHLRTSVDRLLAQAVPLALLVTLEALTTLAARRARPVKSNLSAAAR